MLILICPLKFDNYKSENTKTYFIQRLQQNYDAERRGKLLTKIREKTQKWIVFSARLAHNIGFTPNQMSAFGVLFAILSAFMYWNWRLNDLLLIIAPVFLLLSGFCDMLDGALARIYGELSTFGGFLDSLLDRYADASVFIGIILGGLCNSFWGLIALIGSLFVSYTRAKAEAEGVKMETIGLAERAERIILLATATFLNIVYPITLSWAVVVLAIATHLTVLQRAKYFYSVSREKKITSLTF